jgi:hypothetical protein
MAELLSVATTAVSLAKVAMVDSGEVGRSAVYSRYKKDHRTLPWWGTPALAGVTILRRRLGKCRHNAKHY